MTDSIKIEMISTGDEVLYGQIVDTNAAWLSDFLFQHGFTITSRLTVGDKLEQLVEVLTSRTRQNDIIIFNGGLGPTSDDLTAQAAALANNESLELHLEWVEEMERYFSQRGKVMPVSNRKQAMIPQSSEVIANPVGTACGFMMTINGCIVFFSPGVPSEFKQMVNEQILPRMQARYPNISAPLCYRLTTMGRSESDLAEQIDRCLVVPQDISVGYRSAMPIIELKLTGSQRQQSEMDRLWQQLKALVHDNLLFEGTIGLAGLVSQLLSEQGLTLAIIEGYSAGLLSYSLLAENAPVKKAEIVTLTSPALLQLAQQSLLNNQVDLVIVLGDLDESNHHFPLYLVSAECRQCFILKYTSRQQARPTLQAILSAVALDLLRRHLQKLPLVGESMWLEVVSASEEK